MDGSRLTQTDNKLTFVNMAIELPSLFARRLQQARAMRGLSLRGLEEAMHGAVSHNALAKYERGEMLPGSDVLIALADALSQSADFFVRPFRIEVSQVRFRKKAKLGIKRQAAVRELATDFVERYREAEELVGDVRVFQPPLHNRVIQSVNDAETAADELRNAWNLGTDPLPNVFELLESKGIKVLELPDEDRDFDGLSAATDVGPVVVVATHLDQNLPRKRMTEVHELGHIVTSMTAGVDEKTEERLVAAFAGAFLLPRESFVEAFGQHREKFTVAELVAIKARFGASIMAIMRRALSLKLITDATYKSFCVVTSKWGWRSADKGEPGDDLYPGCESHSRFRQLVRRAVAEELISLSKGAALLGEPIEQVRKDLRQIIG